ncbi:MAG: hypothetical protein QOG63_1940 [Thermoleophilaceae bacterium]|jgi:hypothetical protein|nr:hypothetical protein [Thermoleophilaceae bacterium]
MRRNALIALSAAAASSATALALATAGSADTAGRTFALYEHGIANDVRFVDSRPWDRASAGDEALIVHWLSDDRGNRRGTMYVSCEMLRAYRDLGKSPSLCNATIKLRDGTLTAQGVLPRSGSLHEVLAITGGTGAYNGATGTLTSDTSRGGTTNTFRLRE